MKLRQGGREGERREGGKEGEMRGKGRRETGETQRREGEREGERRGGRGTNEPGQPREGYEEKGGGVVEKHLPKIAPFGVGELEEGQVEIIAELVGVVEDDRGRYGLEGVAVPGDGGRERT